MDVQQQSCVWATLELRKRSVAGMYPSPFLLTLNRVTLQCSGSHQLEGKARGSVRKQ